MTSSSTCDGRLRAGCTPGCNTTWRTRCAGTDFGPPAPTRSPRSSTSRTPSCWPRPPSRQDRGRGVPAAVADGRRGLAGRVGALRLPAAGPAQQLDPPHRRLLPMARPYRRGLARRRLPEPAPTHPRRPPRHPADHTGIPGGDAGLHQGRPAGAVLRTAGDRRRRDPRLRRMPTTVAGICWPCWNDCPASPGGTCNASACPPPSATPTNCPPGSKAAYTRPRTVVAPAAATSVTPDVTVDFVGSVANAATVISSLHRGEKRLVFVESRRQAEELARRCGKPGSRPTCLTRRCPPRSVADPRPRSPRPATPSSSPPPRWNWVSTSATSTGSSRSAPPAPSRPFCNASAAPAACADTTRNCLFLASTTRACCWPRACSTAGRTAGWNRSSRPPIRATSRRNN